MISIRLWNKLCVLRNYSICAGSICKTKLGQFVFDNLKPARLCVFYSTEQDLTPSRMLDYGTSNNFKNKPRYQSHILSNIKPQEPKKVSKHGPHLVKI
jgi:hypothetical protein